MNNTRLSVNKARILAKFVQQSEDHKLEVRRKLIERALAWYELRNIMKPSKQEKRL